MDSSGADNDILINSGLPSASTAKSDFNKFPQTGQKSSTWQIGLGIVLLSITGFISHIIWRQSN